MAVSLTTAQEIAEVALRTKIQAAEKLRNFAFAKTRLIQEHPHCWTFAAPSEEMWEAGYAPAALFVYIDKSDGHVWTAQEQDDYFYAAEKKSQRQPVAA